MSVQVELPQGLNLEIEPYSKDESDIFDNDIRRIFESYSKYIEPGARDAISNVFEEDFETLKVIGQMAKKDIIGGGVFNGAFATTGHGIQQIRPDFLVPTAQGRTFYASLSGLTADSWYGLWHNGAIGAAYNDNPLYIRKWLEIAITGFLDVSPSPMVEEVQFEINGRPIPIFNMAYQQLGSTARVFHFPKPVVLKPYLQFRSQFKVNTTAGDFKLLPLGVAFVKAEYMRLTQPEQPDTSSP